MKGGILVLAAICISAPSLALDTQYRFQTMRIRLPPTIIKGPARFTYYREGDPLNLQCEAHGRPKPMIEWKKNGEMVDLSSSHITLKQNGNLSFIPLSIMDNGTYQCFARNRHGRAMSNYSHLIRAILSNFNHALITHRYTYEGESLIVPCQTGASIPLPAFTWLTATSKTDAKPKAVTETNRVNVDKFGNLIFSNVKMSDHKPNRLYFCRAFNFMIGSLEQGSYTRIMVTYMSNPPQTAPKSVYTPKGHYVIGLVGSDVTLQCIFSGNPTPVVSWTRNDNRQMSPRVNSDETQVKTILLINKLQDEDGGVYVCEGLNSEGRERVTITLDVQAVPYFVDDKDHPRNFNATQGKDVTFSCNPKAEPPANVQWYINGTKIRRGRAGPKRTISDDRETLKIHEVCKTDCGVADLINVQCEAYNIHGSVFSDGYLNVLEKTTVTVTPVVSVLQYEGTVQFECAATSDPATPFEIIWLKDGVEIGYVENRIWKDPDTNTLHIDSKEDQDHGANRAGTYTCWAYNGYSDGKENAVLELPPGTVPPPRQVKIESGFTMWWLVVLVAIILLLLIMLLFCCIFWQYFHGDSYPVDEKERKHGNDPEKELADHRMQDYQRPETDPIGGSRASLLASSKLDTSCEGHQAGFSDLDPLIFNVEDAFIGRYTIERTTQQHRTVNTTV